MVLANIFNNYNLCGKWKIVFFLFLINSVTFAQTPVYNLTQFQDRFNKNNDTVYVVNFWATWCKPCIEELPFFESVRKEYISSPVQFVLVSLDAKSRTQQVSQFINNNHYGAEVFLLSAGNPNIWIDKIEPKWSGSIPATLLYKNGKQLVFYEGDFAASEDLKKFIQSNL